jgi:hypothetical protein
MALRWYTVVVDCLDVTAQAEWWRETLGWQTVYEADDEVVIAPAHLTEELARSTPGSRSARDSFSSRSQNTSSSRTVSISTSPRTRPTTATPRSPRCWRGERRSSTSARARMFRGRCWLIRKAMNSVCSRRAMPNQHCSVGLPPPPPPWFKPIRGFRLRWQIDASAWRRNGSGRTKPR